MVEYKEPSQRQLRVGQEIKKLIAAMLERGEVHNPIISNAFITLTEARISPDLKYCDIYVMTLNADNLVEVVKALNELSWLARKQISAKLQLRYAPEVFFKVDPSFEQVDKIEKLLRDPKVAQDLQKLEQESVE